MSLFRRHRRDAEATAEHVPGLRDALLGQGWRAAPPSPFDGDLEPLCTQVALAMHNLPSGPLSLRAGPVIQGSNFRDAYRGVVDGRTVTVANAWLTMHDPTFIAMQSFHGTSVCAVELPAVISPMCVQPRSFRAVVPGPEAPTGDPQFDERFLVSAPPGIARQMLAPEVRRLIQAREDWAFVGEGSLLGCIGRGAFGTVDEVRERIDAVMDVVRAIPASVLPDHIDRSVDDLMARIARVDDIEGAMALLQSLSDEDRQRLASSGTPLAVMADVRTPEEAMQRFQSMDMAQRAQLLAMFARVNE